MNEEEINKLINNFQNDNGYITDYNLVLGYLESNNFSEDDIADIFYKIIENNNKIYKNLEIENKKLKIIKEQLSNAKSIKQFIPFVNNSTIPICEELSKTEKKCNGVDITYYIEEINSHGKLTDFTDVLPKIYNPDFDIIINKLLLHYFSLEVAFLKMLKDDVKDIKQEEWQKYVKEEIHTNKIIIDTIKNYQKSFDNNTDIESDYICTEKNILFIKESIFDDIEKIPEEQKKEFLVLIESIKNDVLKNVKRFTPMGALKMVSEVRNNTARILFDKIDSDTYLVYYVFIKKDSDKYYHETLILRADCYQKIKSQLLAPFNKNKGAYLKENKIIESKVLELLDPVRKRRI